MRTSPWAAFGDYNALEGCRFPHRRPARPGHSSPEEQTQLGSALGAGL